MIGLDHLQPRFNPEDTHFRPPGPTVLLAILTSIWKAGMELFRESETS